ncbi:MAG TPA: hypothetical protein V6D18_14675 [Thermosynechococcaceae cyanobacterium]
MSWVLRQVKVTLEVMLDWTGWGKRLIVKRSLESPEAKTTQVSRQE